jgi:hypothetical protein
MAKAPTPIEEAVAPEVVAAPAPAFAVESNNAITVEDNTEVLEAVPAEVTEVTIPLMDGFTQVNYV